MENTFNVQGLFNALGTINYVRISSDHDQSILRSIEQRIRKLDDYLSLFKKDSEVSRINKLSGLSAVHVGSDTFTVIEKAVDMAKCTKGAYDISINPVMELWRIAKKTGILPDRYSIQKTLDLVNYKDISLDKDISTVFLKRKGQSIDLGGIAKGYAVDIAREMLKKAGINNAIINFGGTVCAFGTSFDVGIQHPLMQTNCSCGSITLADECIATSGIYQNNFKLHGLEYHHIIDKSTGYPVENSLLSVSVIGQEAAMLDAVATAALINWPDEYRRITKKHNLSYVYITKDLDVLASKKVEILDGKDRIA
jgi:thiamine biosynthesis lipoprotein